MGCRLYRALNGAECAVEQRGARDDGGAAHLTQCGVDKVGGHFQHERESRGCRLPLNAVKERERADRECHRRN